MMTAEQSIMGVNFPEKWRREDKKLRVINEQIKELGVLKREFNEELEFFKKIGGSDKKIKGLENQLIEVINQIKNLEKERDGFKKF